MSEPAYRLARARATPGARGWSKATVTGAPRSDLKPAAAQVGGRRLDREAARLGAAHEPAGIRRPAHVELDSQPLAGRERASRPQPSVADAHRYLGAARRAHMHLLEGSPGRGRSTRASASGSSASPACGRPCERPRRTPATSAAATPSAIHARASHSGRPPSSFACPGSLLARVRAEPPDRVRSVPLTSAGLSAPNEPGTASASWCPQRDFPLDQTPPTRRVRVRARCSPGRASSVRMRAATRPRRRRWPSVRSRRRRHSRRRVRSAEPRLESRPLRAAAARRAVQLRRRLAEQRVRLLRIRPLRVRPLRARPAAQLVCRLRRGAGRATGRAPAGDLVFFDSLGHVGLYVGAAASSTPRTRAPP